jgi:hypothetical protein
MEILLIEEYLLKISLAIGTMIFVWIFIYQYFWQDSYLLWRMSTYDKKYNLVYQDYVNIQGRNFKYWHKKFVEFTVRYPAVEEDYVNWIELTKIVEMMYSKANKKEEYMLLKNIVESDILPDNFFTTRHAKDVDLPGKNIIIKKCKQIEVIDIEEKTLTTR